MHILSSQWLSFLWGFFYNSPKWTNGIPFSLKAVQ